MQQQSLLKVHNTYKALIVSPKPRCGFKVKMTVLDLLPVLCDRKRRKK